MHRMSLGLIDTLGLQIIIHYIGPVPDEDLPLYMLPQAPTCFQHYMKVLGYHVGKQWL